MRELLFQYHGVSPTTWVYLSSLLMIGLFFKFSRFWSVRNLDLIMLIGLAPGLLLVHFGTHIQKKEAADGALAGVTNIDVDADLTSTDGLSSTDGLNLSDKFNSSDRAAKTGLPDGARLEQLGYLALFLVGGAWLIRLLMDPAMVRRPLLAPNLSVGGLSFIGVSLFAFLIANVVVNQPGEGLTTDNFVRMDSLLTYQQNSGPGYAVLNVLPLGAIKTVAILSHVAIVLGVVLIGYRHFENTTNGIGAAMLFLMLPYTSQMTSRVDHFLPAAFLVWAVLCYRRPVISGIFLGAACGCVYYPLFLLPLWLSFYWQRGVLRFSVALTCTLIAMALSLLFIPESGGFVADLQRMFGILQPAKSGLMGMWREDNGGWAPSYRLPVLAAFVALSGSLALWPATKNLGTLLSCSAAVMLASQFWHGYGGGMYMGWYLPLVMLTVFRPNLEDRGVQNVFGAARSSRARTRVAA